MPIARRKSRPSPDQAFIPLKTMDAVIEKLDGDAGIKKLTGAAQNNLGNWRKIQKKFPARYFLIMTRELATRGYTAPAKLWGITEPS